MGRISKASQTHGLRRPKRNFHDQPDAESPCIDWPRNARPVSQAGRVSSTPSVDHAAHVALSRADAVDIDDHLMPFGSARSYFSCDEEEREDLLQRVDAHIALACDIAGTFAQAPISHQPHSFTTHAFNPLQCLSPRPEGRGCSVMAGWQGGHIPWP